MSEGGWSAVLIHPDDDVAVALRALEPGAVRVRRGDAVIDATLAEPIALGHKFALHDIAPGEPVRKYGDSIGVAASAIKTGAHVHVHNLRSERARKAD
ncbi:MAG: hypothetical protein BGP06_10415 [Rhizobiales bacterium 65-9]|nr:MAG: hypothetical protein BGP06_10415 [Rhizobiales bacterium 65-9]